MTSAALLIVFGFTAGTWGARALAHAAWTTSAPRLAIAAWQALAASVLLSLLAAGAALSISLQHVRADLAGLFHLCAENLRSGYASPAGGFVATIGVTTVGALVARTAWCALRVTREDRRIRRERVAVLDIVARPHAIPGVLVLDHHSPYAFCIGGRRHRVVITSGLLTTLDRREVEAVLAHEAAHLKQRHHLALILCRTLFGTLSPFFPSFGEAMTTVRHFAELSADDSARRAVGAVSLRSALSRLACLPAPSGALAASDTDVEARLNRLTDADYAMRPRRALLTGLSIAALVTAPLALAVAPAVAMAWDGICLIG